MLNHFVNKSIYKKYINIKQKLCRSNKIKNSQSVNYIKLVILSMPKIIKVIGVLDILYKKIKSLKYLKSDSMDG